MEQSIISLLEQFGIDLTIPITNLQDLIPLLFKFTIGMIFIFFILKIIKSLTIKVTTGGLI